MANSRKPRTKNRGRNFGKSRNKGPVPEISRTGQRIIRKLALFACIRRWALKVLFAAAKRVRQAVSQQPVALLADWSVTTGPLRKAEYRSNRQKANAPAFNYHGGSFNERVGWPGIVAQHRAYMASQL